MGGVIDYAALPTIVDMVGVQDPERLIHQLASLRDFQRSKES